MTIDLLIVLIGHLINTDYNDIRDHPRSTFSVKQIYQGLYDHLRQCHNIATTGHTLMIWVLRPQCLTAHLSAFTIRLWQLSSNGVAFLFWRSLTSLKWQGKARGLCVNLGQYQFDICFPWRSITVIFCFPTQALWFCRPALLRQVGSDECGSDSGRWKMMNGNNHTWPSVEAAQSSNTKKMIIKGVLFNRWLLYDVLYGSFFPHHLT